MVTLGWIPRHPATLLAALCIASWITLGEMADNVGDVIAEACTASTGSGAHCFQLYALEEAASWVSAVDFCRTRGLRLATVQDSQAQEALVNVSGLFQHGTRHAWIAGRHSTDATWRATGSTLSYEIPDHPGRYCSQLVRRDPDMTFDLMAAPCVYTEFTTASSLCQYPRTSGSCEGGWFPLDDQCFHVVTQETGSWYDSRADCRGAGPPGVEGDLAYSHLTDPRLFQELPRETPHTLWVGVYRNPWVWRTADLTEMEISEFFWVSGEGTSPSLSDCLYADLRVGSSWGDRPCSDSLDYVICEQVKPIETTPAPGSSQSSPRARLTSETTPAPGSSQSSPRARLTTETTPAAGLSQSSPRARLTTETTPAPGLSQSSPRARLTTDLSNQRTTATSSDVADRNVTATEAVESQGLRQGNSILIGCLAGGIGVLSLVVIIFVIMLRRRKKQSKPKPRSTNTGLDGSPYAVTTIVTSPEIAGNNYRGLPNSDDASWTWENHVTPSESSGPLQPGIPGPASPRPGEGDYDEPWDDIMTRLGLQPPEPDLISQAGARGPPGSIPMATLRAERWAAVPLKHPDLAANPYRRSIHPAS